MLQWCKALVSDILKKLSEGSQILGREVVSLNVSFLFDFFKERILLLKSKLNIYVLFFIFIFKSSHLSFHKSNCIRKKYSAHRREISIYKLSSNARNIET